MAETLLSKQPEIKNSEFEKQFPGMLEEFNNRFGLIEQTEASRATNLENKYMSSERNSLVNVSRSGSPKFHHVMRDPADPDHGVAFHVDDMVLIKENEDDSDVHSCIRIHEFSGVAYTTFGEGLNKLEEGLGQSVVPDTWYYLWIISNKNIVYNNEHEAVSGVAALISTRCNGEVHDMNVPDGYDYKALIGCFRTDGSADIIDFQQAGNFYEWGEAITIVAADVPSNVWTNVDFNPWVPECMHSVFVTVFLQHILVPAAFYSTRYGGSTGNGHVRGYMVNNMTEHVTNSFLTFLDDDKIMEHRFDVVCAHEATVYCNGFEFPI